MTTTLPTPEILRERAANALHVADKDATNHLYDGPGRESVYRNAVALAAYARELLTIAAQLNPAPSTAAPAEVSPPDDSPPARGDVYEYAETHYAVAMTFPGDDCIALVAVESPTEHRVSVAPDFVRRFCRRVSPAREAATHPARGDLYRHASTGDEWVVCALDAEHVYLAGARPCLGLAKPLTMSRELFAAEMERAS